MRETRSFRDSIRISLLDYLWSVHAREDIACSMVGEFGPNGTHADGDRYAYCKHGTDRGGSWAGWTAGYVDSKLVHNKLVRLGRFFFFWNIACPLWWACSWSIVWTQTVNLFFSSCFYSQHQTGVYGCQEINRCSWWNIAFGHDFPEEHADTLVQFPPLCVSEPY
jgi:hypothetical protein